MNLTQKQRALNCAASKEQFSMNRPLAVLATLFLAAHCLPGAGAPADWQPLFNGTNLTGWKVQCKPEDRSKTYWRVEDGCIVADSMADSKHDYIWLQTEREFGDFELRLKFQAFRNSPGNSGVQFRSRYDETAGWLDGPQLDIHPPGPWRTGFIYDETRGVQKWIAPSLPKVSDARPEMAPPNLVMYYSDDTPAWNELEISARGTRVRAVLNGVVVRDWDGAGVLDDATHRERNVGLRGHLALQIHKGDRLKIRFKEIYLCDLGDRTSASTRHPPSKDGVRTEASGAEPVRSGPLRVSAENPRYFADGSGRIVYLTGSHTWASMQDIGFTDPPTPFDFDAYLNFLVEHHHNFFRLWRFEPARWTDRHAPDPKYFTPHPWKRTGPGLALDGKPKFDLNQLDPAYFDRLRSRVAAAGERNIHVSVMLFEGWGLSFASWDGHPFNVHNNLQGINGDPDGDGKGTESHTLAIPAITRIQEAYVRRVIETVNDLDNVLFEIANESDFGYSADWQYLKFPRQGGQGAENLRKKSRHVHENETDSENLRC
jgi:hypothetical protein